MLNVRHVLQVRAKDAHVDIGIARETSQRPPCRVRDLVRVSRVQETRDIDVEDEIPPTLHHIVPAVLGRDAHPRLLIELSLCALLREFSAVAVSLGKGPFLGTSPFNEKDVSKRI